LCSPKSISKEVQRLEEYRALAALSAQSLKKNDATVKLAHRCCLKHFESMLAEEPIAWEGIEIEGVHQMRVATRRIRAALSAFKFLVQPDAREVFSREFKWLARVLGDVRDMDVCLENLRGYVMEIPADDANCLEAYRLHLAEQRKRARRELIACLSGVRYRRLVSDFSEYLKLGLSAESPSSHEFDSIRESAVRLIGKQYKRVLRQGRSITRQSPDQELHALRIECKRLRYRFEFFRSTYRSSLNPFIKSLKTLQNVLGEFQDAQVATQQLTEHAQCVPMESGNRGQLLALGQLIDSQRRHAWDRRKRFHKTWKRFDRRHARKRMLKLLR
jgi:CHAD domain-containing protein